MRVIVVYRPQRGMQAALEQEMVDHVPTDPPTGIAQHRIGIGAEIERTQR